MDVLDLDYRYFYQHSIKHIYKQKSKIIYDKQKLIVYLNEDEKWPEMSVVIKEKPIINNFTGNLIGIVKYISSIEK